MLHTKTMELFSQLTKISNLILQLLRQKYTVMKIQISHSGPSTFENDLQNLVHLLFSFIYSLVYEHLILKTYAVRYYLQIMGM